MTAVIILNSPQILEKVFHQKRAETDVVICCDGGANRAFEIGVPPDFVIGDLDSLSEESRKKLSAESIVHRPSQYKTDLEKALDFALEKGVTGVEVFGVAGGRLDHQLTNIQMLQKYAGLLRIKFYDESGYGFFIDSSAKFRAQIGQQISLIAFKRVSGVQTQGLKYALNGENLEWGVRDGQSNEAIEEDVEISVRKGVLTVFCVWLETSKTDE